MTIDPTTVPIGAVVQCDPTGVRTHLRNTECPEMGITRVFVPVPDGMTLADAEAALADAGAWVEVETVNGLPHGARMRNNWRRGDPADDRTYVHRDDLPPTDPDADLVEKMARANFELAWPGCDWATWADHTKDRYRTRASAVLAVVREHEATR